jgi:hypothetical protein
MAVGQRNHYLPVFYLKQWAGPDGCVCEFSRPHKIVKPRRTHPAGTGYERGLYRFDGLPPIAANFLEQQFLLHVDDRAYFALCHLLADFVDFDAETHSAWSRFMMSLLHRNPEAIARIKRRTAEYVESGGLQEYWATHVSVRADNEFHTYEEFRSMVTDDRVQGIALNVLHSIMDSERVGTLLNRMVWGVIAVQRPKFPILTSDRPLIMTNGLVNPGSHILLPISPDRVFVGAATRETMDEIAKMANNTNRFVGTINDFIAKQARKYVYGTDDRQLRFVENRLGQRIRSTPLE